MPGHTSLRGTDHVPIERDADHRPPLRIVECKRKATADQIRSQWPDVVVDDQDDGRRKRVVCSGDALEEWLAQIVGEAAADYRTDAERYGQEPLTLTERRRIDFSETNVFHARACKAIASGNDVDDWLAFYDADLTVDEHRDIYRRERGGLTGREMSDPFRASLGGVAA